MEALNFQSACLVTLFVFVGSSLNTGLCLPKLSNQSKQDANLLNFFSVVLQCTDSIMLFSVSHFSSVCLLTTKPVLFCM